jgi:hypothetical protein
MSTCYMDGAGLILHVWIQKASGVEDGESTLRRLMIPLPTKLATWKIFYEKVAVKKNSTQLPD